MKKLTLTKLLDEYKQYREQRNESENNAKATHPETCRQNLNDIMIVMGIDFTLFKDPANERSYRFAESDKHLVFELLDRFSSTDFALMRKGRYLEVPDKSLRFYLKTLSTLLEHLEIDTEVIRDQKEKMMRQTSYALAVELQNVQRLMAGINHDINQILEEVTEKASDSRYLDAIALLNDLGAHLHSLRDRTRYLFHFMGTERDLEEFSNGVESLRRDPHGKERIKKLVRLDQALWNNEKYVELREESTQLADEVLFSKSKRLAFFKAQKEMEKISKETQIREFGELIVPTGEDGKTENPPRISSKDTLLHAVEAYQNLLAIQQITDDPGDVPIAVERVAQRFHEKTYGKRSGKSMNIHSIFNIVLAVHLELDWDMMTNLEEAYEAYSAFSDSKQEEFNRLVNEAAEECDRLFRSFPEMYQTKLDLDILDEIREEIFAKLEHKFEAFLQ